MDDATVPGSSLDKKAVRTSPLLWVLAAALAALLCALGTRALLDVADLFPEPSVAPQRDALLAPLIAARDALAERDAGRHLRIERAQRDLDAIDRAVSTAEETWRTWLETRGTLGGSADEDRQVRARRDRLDRLRAERDEAAQRVAALRREADPFAEERRALDARLAAAEAQAAEAYGAALRGWRLRVLGARLALVAPVAALGVWLWGRRRRTRYPTLLWGYLAFAAWMVGDGIYPYLPHYGGYVPLAAGVLAAVAASVSLVRYFNARTAERRRRIVDRAIARHRCPGCERDYLLGREVALDLGIGRKSVARHFDEAALRPPACPACGLPLFRPCPACGAVQVAHLDRCARCGAASAAEPAPEQLAG